MTGPRVSPRDDTRSSCIRGRSSALGRRVCIMQSSTSSRTSRTVGLVDPGAFHLARVRRYGRFCAPDLGHLRRMPAFCALIRIQSLAPRRTAWRQFLAGPSHKGMRERLHADRAASAMAPSASATPETALRSRSSRRCTIMPPSWPQRKRRRAGHRISASLWESLTPNFMT